MSNVVLRSKQDQTASEPVKLEQTKAGDASEPVRESTVEVPFSEYEKQNNKPFLVDYYELGTFWNRGDMYDHAFSDEVRDVTEYLNFVIERGDINNTIESVKNELKRIERLTNVKKDSKKAVRLGIIAEYTKFILKSDKIKRDSAKYGMV